MDPLAIKTPAGPGWYVDPAGSERLRWWDGTAWAETFQENAGLAPGMAATGGVQQEWTSVPANEQDQSRPGFSKNSIVAFVVGCIGLFIFPYIGVAAIFAAIRGLRETKNGSLRGRSLAIAGLVLGPLDLILWAYARLFLQA